MRCLNEGIVRRANEEDNCKGRFWEGRYKSQALLDEAALLTCMSYVDLNPIRAGIAETPEDSDYTSIKERIVAYRSSANRDNNQLLGFVTENDPESVSIPFQFFDYLQLVEWTGRAIRDDKRGAIPYNIAPILQRLGIEPSEWVDGVQCYGKHFYRVLGALDVIKRFGSLVGQKWLRGQGAAKRMYCVPS